MKLFLRSGWRAVVALPFLMLLASCASDVRQDTLEPEGPAAADIDDLFNLIAVIAVIVGILVFAAIIFIIIRYRARDDGQVPEQVHGNTKLEVGWTIAPAVLLMVVAVPTVALNFDLDAREDDAVVNIDVYGQQWWWEFRYDEGVVTANELVFPADTPVNLTLRSRDVIHSFWLPRLNGKLDVVPGRTHTLAIESFEPGVFFGQCVEFCGLSHADMRIRAIALEPDDYEAWLEDQTEPVEALPAPDELDEDDPIASAARGQEVFGQFCVSCHVVDGVFTDAADGNAALVSGAAPNLTHLMTRTGFAGAIYDLYTSEGEVNIPDLRAWVHDAPSRKAMAPEDQRGMPSFADALSDEDLEDVLAYLQTLGDAPMLPAGAELEDILRP